MKKCLVFCCIVISCIVSTHAMAREIPGTEGKITCAEVTDMKADIFNAEGDRDMEKAMEIFHEVIDNDSACVPALIGYSRAMDEASGFEIGINDYMAAYEYLARALVLEPDNPEALWVMADLQRHVARYDRAISLARRAVELAPGDPWARYVLGSSLMVADTGAAIEQLEKALELRPEWGVVKLNLSAAYVHAGEYNKAIELLNPYIEENPKDAKALTNRAIAYLNLGKLDKAETDFKNALSIEPRFGTALKGRGDLYMARKDYDAAIKSYKLALISMSKDPTLWRALLEAQKKAGKIDDAIVSYNKLMEFYPQDENLKKGLAELEAMKSAP